MQSVKRKLRLVIFFGFSSLYLSPGPVILLSLGQHWNVETTSLFLSVDMPPDSATSNIFDGLSQRLVLECRVSLKACLFLPIHSKQFLSYVGQKE